MPYSQSIYLCPTPVLGNPRSGSSPTMPYEFHPASRGTIASRRDQCERSRRLVGPGVVRIRHPGSFPCLYLYGQPWPYGERSFWWRGPAIRGRGTRQRNADPSIACHAALMSKVLLVVTNEGDTVFVDYLIQCDERTRTAIDSTSSSQIRSDGKKQNTTWSSAHCKIAELGSFRRDPHTKQRRSHSTEQYPYSG